MSYSDVYNQRLNKYGTTFDERIQGLRAAQFTDYKTTSTYKVNFSYNDTTIIGTLEPYKEDETRTLQYLLVDLTTTFNPGTVLLINENYWMIFYLNKTESKGYNKYCVLNVNYSLTWIDRDGTTQISRGYFFGKMDRIIYDLIKSTARQPNYQEPNKETHIIMPTNLNLKREDYIEIDGEGYIVTGYDYNSTPGVEYFSLKETYLRNTTTITPDNSREDNFWLNGGNS